MRERVAVKVLELAAERLSRVASQLVAIERRLDNPPPDLRYIISDAKGFVANTQTMIRAVERLQTDSLLSDAVRASACRCAVPATNGPGGTCVFCGRQTLDDLITAGLEKRYGAAVTGETRDARKIAREGAL